jgi:hypothetical protein
MFIMQGSDTSPMDLNDILTLILAAYGAILATVLGLRELQKERRTLSIILEYLLFYEVADLIITNVGHRPTTITRVAISVMGEQNGRTFWEDVPANAILRAEAKLDPLPITISDGEFTRLELNNLIGQAMLNGKGRVRITVYDIEGNEYTKFSTRYYNAKWGYYEKYGSLEDMPIIHRLHSLISSYLWRLRDRRNS